MKIHRQSFPLESRGEKISANDLKTIFRCAFYCTFFISKAQNMFLFNTHFIFFPKTIHISSLQTNYRFSCRMSAAPPSVGPFSWPFRCIFRTCFWGGEAAIVCVEFWASGSSVNCNVSRYARPLGASNF